MNKIFGEINQLRWSVNATTSLGSIILIKDLHLTDEDIVNIQKDVDEAQVRILGWEKSGLSLPVATG